MTAKQQLTAYAIMATVLLLIGASALEWFAWILIVSGLLIAIGPDTGERNRTRRKG